MVVVVIFTVVVGCGVALVVVVGLYIGGGNGCGTGYAPGSKTTYCCSKEQSGYNLQWKPIRKQIFLQSIIVMSNLPEHDDSAENDDEQETIQRSAVQKIQTNKA